MARGWESKSVEQQQEEVLAADHRVRTPVSSEQIAQRQRRQGLEMSRQRILQQLQAACNSRHRDMLQRALADLEAQLASSK